MQIQRTRMHARQKGCDHATLNTLLLFYSLLHGHKLHMIEASDLMF